MYSEDRLIFREFNYLDKKRKTLIRLKASRIVDLELEEVVVIPIQWDILLIRHIAGIPATIRDKVRALCKYVISSSVLGLQSAVNRKNIVTVRKHLLRETMALSSQSKIQPCGFYGFFSQTFYQNLLLFRVNVYNNYNLQLRWVDDKYK